MSDPDSASQSNQSGTSSFTSRYAKTSNTSSADSLANKNTANNGSSAGAGSFTSRYANKNTNPSDSAGTQTANLSGTENTQAKASSTPTATSGHDQATKTTNATSQKITDNKSSTATSAQTVNVTPSKSTPSFTARPIPDKSDEDLKKLMGTLSKLTANLEIGQAFMPVARMLEDMQHRRNCGQLRITLFPLDDKAYQALQLHPLLRGLSTLSSYQEVLWECHEDNSQISPQPFLMRPNSVKLIPFPKGNLGGQRLVLLPHDFHLSAITLGYISHFSDLLIVVGDAKTYQQLPQNISPSLKELTRHANVVYPWLLSDQQSPQTLTEKQLLATLHACLREKSNTFEENVDYFSLTNLRLIEANAENWQTIFAEGLLNAEDNLYPIRHLLLNRSIVRQLIILITVLQQQEEQKFLQLEHSLAQIQTQQQLFNSSNNSGNRKLILQRLQVELLTELDLLKEMIDAKGKNEISNKKALVMHIRKTLESLDKADCFVEACKENFLSSIGLGGIGRFLGNNTIILSLSNVAADSVRKGFKLTMQEHIARIGRHMEKDVQRTLQLFEGRLREEAELDEYLTNQIVMDNERVEEMLNDQIYTQFDSTTATYQVKFERKGALAHISKARMVVGSLVMLAVLIASTGIITADRKQIAGLTGYAIGIIILINLLFWPSIEKHQKHEYLIDLQEKLFKVLNDSVHKMVGQYCSLFKQQVDREQKNIKQQFDAWIRLEDEQKNRRQAELEQISKKQKEQESVRKILQDSLQGSLSKPGIHTLQQETVGLNAHLQMQIRTALSNILQSGPKP